MKIGKIGKIENIIPVVADGGIAHPDVNDGHIIPVLVVDCLSDSVLVDLCHIHQDTPPGDVETVWLWKLPQKRYVYLQLVFRKPVKATATIKLDVRKQGGLVYGIMAAHAFYLQPSSFGSTVSAGFGKPNILIEVPSNVTPPNWDSIFERQLVKRFKDDGYEKSQAEQSAKQYIKRAKETWLLQMSRRSQSSSQEPE